MKGICFSCTVKNCQKKQKIRERDWCRDFKPKNKAFNPKIRPLTKGQKALLGKIRKHGREHFTLITGEVDA